MPSRHGCRSNSRNWAAERADPPLVVIKAALGTRQATRCRRRIRARTCYERRGLLLGPVAGQADGARRPRAATTVFPHGIALTWILFRISGPNRPPRRGIRDRRNRHDVKSRDRFGRCQPLPQLGCPRSSSAVQKADRPTPARRLHRHRGASIPNWTNDGRSGRFQSAATCRRRAGCTESWLS